MTASTRDQRVQFQRLTTTDDGYGGQIETWATIFSRWCEVRPLSGRERDMAQQTESPRNYQIMAPWGGDSDMQAITTADRIVWRGKTMQIRFIADAGPQADEVRIDCEDGVAT